MSKEQVKNNNTPYYEYAKRRYGMSEKDSRELAKNIEEAVKENAYQFNLPGGFCGLTEDYQKWYAKNFVDRRKSPRGR